ncbi:Translation initiation factor [Geranomyces variabilis]|uniref:Translation initiation factor eIF2B subunit alpha n=1 Tax=Geranomyces variabilis TaxID=109894 RepID=A0AAD5TCS6_9FUNG|nr:Translation initiation factor [Geranomyces variabilis]
MVATAASAPDEKFGGITALERLRSIQKENPDVSLSVIVVMALVDIMKNSQTKSTSEFSEYATRAANAFKSLPEKTASMIAGADLFLDPLPKMMVNAGKGSEVFSDWLKNIFESFDKKFVAFREFREKAATNGLPFVKDNAVILVHSYSRAVMLLLRKAHGENKRFKVFVTETSPTSSGTRAVQELRKFQIPAELILDAAVGFIMDRVDMVIAGAEGVVQNGGIINQIGTYQIAVVAKAANKPFYVVTEQYKFVPLFPLSQSDLPIPLPKYFDSADGDKISPRNPNIDYTPPEYISLLFTNVGVLTPSGVSEELIKFFMG